MTSTKWITKSQIQTYKQLSNSSFNDKLDEIIIASQFEDIQPLIGEEFYNAINRALSNSEATYDDLLNGGDYTYNGTTFRNYGLRAVLAYYISARYTMFGDVIDNAFGKTLKLNDTSQPISDSTRKALYNMDRNTAYNYWLNVERYLIRTDHELYKNRCSKTNNKFKISRIG